MNNYVLKWGCSLHATKNWKVLLTLEKNTGEMLEYIHHNKVQCSSSAYPKQGEIPFRNIFLVKIL